MIKRFVINNKIVMMRYFRLNVFVMKYSEINKIMINYFGIDKNYDKIF